MDEKIRVNLGNDQWWDIKPIQTQGMRKQIKKQAQDSIVESMRTGARGRSAEVEMIDAMDMSDQIVAFTLIVMSIGWSWPTPINTKTIEERESWMIDAVLVRMNDTYTRTPEQIKALEKNLQEPS